jgi:hypothetical protein
MVYGAPKAIPKPIKEVDEGRISGGLVANEWWICLVRLPFQKVQ